MHWIPAILILPYFILILKIYRNLNKIKHFDTPKTNSAFVSVVVACRNEEKNLPKLLEKLSAQDYSSNLFEIIIVDDNSTDRTGRILSDFKDVPIKIIQNEGFGKKQALRNGIRSASGQLIITTDADCEMGSGWLRTIASFYEEYKPDMIICPVKVGSSGTLFGKIQELEFMSLQGVTAGSAMADNATMCNGANLAFTRKAYMNHSSDLHEELISGDDIFFLHELKRNDKSKIFWLESADAIVTTAASPDLRSFLKQRVRWISKTGAYRDRFSIFLGIATLMASILQVSYFAGSFIDLYLLPVFLIILVLKSIPDFLILSNTCKRYNRQKLMRLFLPVQLFYPFYVLMVLVLSIRNPQFRHPQSH